MQTKLLSCTILTKYFIKRSLIECSLSNGASTLVAFEALKMERVVPVDCVS